MKIPRNIFLLALLLLISSTVEAQFKRHNKLEVKLEVNIERSGEKLLYKYSLRNSAGSSQELESIRIELGDISEKKNGTISEITQILEEGKKWVGNTSNTKAKPINKKARALITWNAEYDTVRNTNDLLVPPESAILPGNQIELTFLSFGLPSVMRFWARGFTEPYTVSEYDSLRHIAGFTADEVAPPWYEDAYQGKTIAPVIPSDTLTNGDFLNQLNSYRSFSCDTTWITNPGICRSLQAKLENVAKQLGRGKTKQAVNGLNAFLNEVAAQRGKHITSEGYALLWFNGLHLLERLGGQRPGKGRGNNPNKNEPPYR